MLNKVLTLVLLSAISFGGYLWYRDSSYADQPIANEAVLGTQKVSDPLIVHDQFAVDDLLVKSVTMEKPGYIALHMSFEGKPGSVIAHSPLLEIGQQKDVVILLTEPIATGTALFAMIHEDDGDGVWEFPGDDGFRLENGAPLMRPIKIQ
ncbi:MAG: hypothetical protein UZ21_OP11001000631 [Microgenomates bacterium OLB22]|nr:MAG: hypothetical protein UZ21_OP11001000631 [Microgenomates bacterium OLB22]